MWGSVLDECGDPFSEKIAEGPELDSDESPCGLASLASIMGEMVRERSCRAMLL